MIWWRFRYDRQTAKRLDYVFIGLCVTFIVVVALMIYFGLIVEHPAPPNLG
jgi:hypothetical protein